LKREGRWDGYSYLGYLPTHERLRAVEERAEPRVLLGESQTKLKGEVYGSICAMRPEGRDPISSRESQEVTKIKVLTLDATFPRLGSTY